MVILIISISLLTITTGIKAQPLNTSSSLQIAASADSSETDSIRQKKTRLMLLPIIFSSPDTRLAIGVLPQIVFRTSGSNNPSSVRLDSYYTQNRQYHLLLRSTLWLRNDSWNLSGKLSVKKWPTSFYGIGNDTPTESREKFTESLLESSIEGNRRIGHNLFAGLSYTLRYGRIEPDGSAILLTSGAITGNGDTWTSSAGIGIRWDTRDNHFYPTRGSYNKFEISTAPKLLGSDFSFTRLTLDLRQYISYHSHVLAFQGVISTSAGDVPFRLLPSVGSALRGYSTVRHIDRNLAAFQLEYRVVPLFWRLGFTAFVGVADVFKQPGDILFNTLKYSAGIGIRYQFSRSEKINIRLDYGVGRNSSGDYIDLNEAF